VAAQAALPLVRAIHWLPLLAVTPMVPALAGLLTLVRPLAGPDALMLLRASGVLLGAGAAFTLADAMAPSTGALPSPRWLVQWLRTVLALGYAGLAWTATYAVVVSRSAQPPPFAGSALVAAVCVAVTMAGAGFAVRRAPERHAASAGPAVLFALLVATLFVPGRWSPWAPTDAPQWSAARNGWLVALVAAVLATALAHRDTR
jgi:hypothetical protein